MPRLKPARARKNSEVRVRLTEEQKKAFAHAARLTGLELSTWLRVVGLRAVEEKVQKKQ